MAALCIASPHDSAISFENDHEFQLRSTQSSPGILQRKFCKDDEHGFQYDEFRIIPKTASCILFDEATDDCYWNSNISDSRETTPVDIQEYEIPKSSKPSTRQIGITLCSFSKNIVSQDENQRPTLYTAHEIQVFDDPDILDVLDPTNTCPPARWTQSSQLLPRPNSPQKVQQLPRSSGDGQVDSSFEFETRSNIAKQTTTHTVCDPLKSLKTENNVATSKEVRKMIQSWERLLQDTEDKSGLCSETKLEQVMMPEGKPSTAKEATCNNRARDDDEYELWLQLSKNPPPSTARMASRELPPDHSAVEVGIQDHHSMPSNDFRSQKSPQGPMRPSAVAEMAETLLLEQHQSLHDLCHGKLSHADIPWHLKTQRSITWPLLPDYGTYQEPVRDEEPATRSRFSAPYPEEVLTAHSSWELSIVDMYSGASQQIVQHVTDPTTQLSLIQKKSSSKSSPTASNIPSLSSTTTRSSTAHHCTPNTQDTRTSLPSPSQSRRNASELSRKEVTSTLTLDGLDTTKPTVKKLIPSPLRPRSRPLEHYSLFPAPEPRPRTPLPRLYRSVSSMMRRHESNSQEQFARGGKSGKGRSRLWAVDNDGSEGVQETRRGHGVARRHKVSKIAAAFGRTLQTLLLCSGHHTPNQGDNWARTHPPQTCTTAPPSAVQHPITQNHGQNHPQTLYPTPQSQPPQQHHLETLATRFLTGCDSQHMDSHDEKEPPRTLRAGVKGHHKGSWKHRNGAKKIPEASRSEDGVRCVVD